MRIKKPPVTNAIRRFLLTFLIAFGVLYLALGAWLYFGQRSILYVPDTTRYPPEMAGLSDMEDVRFEAADGVLISGWYKKGPPGNPIIVYFHGNGGNNINHSRNAKPMLEAGYGLLLVEYRGYGGNPGGPSEEGLYNDGRGALNFLKSEGYTEEDMILFGYSLGTGVAIKMAEETSPKALILQAPYTSIADVAQGRYWFMPVQLLIKDRFDAADAVGGVKAPILVQMGTRDRVIPPKFSEALYEVAPQPKTLTVFEGLGHHDLGDPEVVADVFAFLEGLK